MAKEEIQPELKDITEMIYRYCAANKNEVCFIGSFTGFGGKCEECGEEEDYIVDDKKSRFFAYGDKETLKVMLNELRDVIEEEADKENWVNI